MCGSAQPADGTRRRSGTRDLDPYVRCTKIGAVMAYTYIEPRRFAERVGRWLEAGGPDADVVISCRVRLARNLRDFPFVTRLDAKQAEAIANRLQPLLQGRELDGETLWVDIGEAPMVLRLLLRERYLVSRDLAPTDPRLSARPGRAVAFGASETLSVMINEEDHLRLQSLASGLALRSAWERLRDLDRSLEDEAGFAFSEALGYLTGCPTNVGTGLRASVMLHLPALGIARAELDKVFHAASRTGLAVRGSYGEGSKAAGDFYQVSNQVTLGRSEEDLIADLLELVPCIVAFERRVRSVLMEEHGGLLEDRVRRSYGMLRTARSLTTDVALMHLSNVRLGASLGVLTGLPQADLQRLAIQIQSGHVHALSGGGLEQDLAEPTERDRQRAAYLRRRFAEFGN
jgi:protein arginine kinase